MARTLLRSNTSAETVEPPPTATTRDVVSLSRPTRRRPSWVLIGSLLVGLAALLGAWVFTATTERVSVMVAARDLEPGEVVDVDDMRVIEIGASSELRAVQPAQQDLLLGLAARGPIPAGTVLNADLFAEREQAIPSGMVVVGASLDAGAAPVSSLRAGDRVDVLGVERTTATPAEGASAPAAALLTSGTIWSVEVPSSGSSSALVVAVLVPSKSQGLVAQAAADGLLRLSLSGSG